MSGPHPSRLEGGISPTNIVIKAGNTFTTVNWNLWEVIWTLGENDVASPIVQTTAIGPEHARGHKLQAAIFGGLGLFLANLSKLELRGILSLPQTGEVLMRDILKYWVRQFGVIVDAGTTEWPSATAIWRDTLGTFHLLKEQELHLGRRIIRTQFQMNRVALGDWDTDFSALTAVNDATQIQWTWERLLAAGAELAGEAKIQNPIVLATALPGQYEKQEVIQLNNLADFAEFVAGWLAIVTQYEADSPGEPLGMVHERCAEVSPLLAIVDGDKWTAPELRR